MGEIRPRPLGGENRASGRGGRPLGGRRPLAAVGNRHPILPLGGAEMGAGLCGGQPGEAAVDQQGGQHQGLPHGGAGAVQPEKGNTEIPQAKGGADALVQQIPRQHAVQIAGLQPRLIQRPLQDLPLHGGLRLFPCFLPEKRVAAQLVKISGQRPLPLHPSADVGEGQH